MSDALPEIKQPSSGLVLKQAHQRLSQNPWMGITTNHIPQSLIVNMLYQYLGLAAEYPTPTSTKFANVLDLYLCLLCLHRLIMG